MTQWPLFVACAPGLEPLLAAEVAEVLGEEPEVVEGGVTLEGDASALAALNLRLALASHVLVRVARFPARHFSQLERGLEGVSWTSWAERGAPLEVRVSSRRSRLYHSKAIEERVRRVLGAPHAPGEDEPGPRLLVRIEHDLCTLSLDSSGDPLHRRGYRLRSAKAPLREDLAAAVVRLSGWDRKSPFVDTFCGSGTLGIEAAQWARGLAPGRHRTFAFEAWPSVEASVVAEARATAAAAAVPVCPAPIWMSDRDAGAVEASGENAARAEVRDDVHIAEAPMGLAPVFEAAPEAAVWVSNPPHGRRIGKGPDLGKLYQSLGRRFEGLGAGWSLTLVVRDRKLAYRSGVRLESKLMTDSGGSKIWVLGSTLRTGSR